MYSPFAIKIAGRNTMPQIPFFGLVLGYPRMNVRGYTTHPRQQAVGV